MTIDKPDRRSTSKWNGIKFGFFKSEEVEKLNDSKTFPFLTFSIFFFFLSTLPVLNFSFFRKIKLKTWKGEKLEMRNIMECDEQVWIYD